MRRVWLTPRRLGGSISGGWATGARLTGVPGSASLRKTDSLGNVTILRPGRVRRRFPTESPTVPEGFIRLSVGIEDVEDLWSDLDQALAHIG